MRMMVLLFDVAPRTGAAEDAALRLKSVRVFWDGASVAWRRPGTAALRLKSVRVLGMVLLFEVSEAGY